MRISKREKLLLLALVLVIGAYLFYNFVYVTNKEKIAAKETELEAKKVEAEKILNAIKLEKELIFELQSLNFEISNMTEKFLASIDQENAIIFFNKYFEEYNIKVNSIGFTNVMLTNFTYDPNKPGPASPNYPLQDLKNQYVGNVPAAPSVSPAGEPLTASAESMNISFDFNADYYDLLDFIDFMQKNKIEFVLSNISMTSNLIDSTVTGNTSVSLYSIPKLHDHENMDWVWTDVIEYGRANPFFLDGVVLDPYWTTKYDLTMVLGPIELDIPTVSLGQFRDESYKSYVYADNNSFEDIEISIKEEAGKYYYRYKTILGQYPANYENWVEFVPANEFISIEIRSSARTSASDLSGANLTVKNDTNKLFYINLFNDDAINPRLNLIEGNNVITKIN
jgi:type IV pilus assembly protein PilO